MSYPLFIAPFAKVRVGESVTMIGDEAHHASVVRRIVVGETILIANGLGTAVQGPVTASTKDRVELSVEAVVESPPKPYRLVAVQALAKGDRSQLAVELLTELGVDEIIAWQAERSIVQWKGDRSEKSLAKWQAVAREASKQSRRFQVPEVRLATTKQLLERIGSNAYVLHECATMRLVDAAAHHRSDELIVITGPEGGISQRELELFVEAGAQPALLTEHVLRTSTAGGVALAQLQATWGSYRDSERR